jgi:hypothetical protein
VERAAGEPQCLALPRCCDASFLAAAGFAIEEQFGDWDGQPFAATRPEIITIARRR